MAKMVPVKPEDVPNMREGRRGRITYPLIKEFMETGAPVAMLDREGMQQSTQGLYGLFTAYIRSHKLPIKIITRKGELYFIRLDLDDAGNPVPWSPDSTARTPETENAPFLDDEEVDRRFVEEKDRSDK